MNNLATALVASVISYSSCAWSKDSPDIFAAADFKQGEQLIKEKDCKSCHAKKFGGDGSAIYRPLERVNTPGLLRGMVEQCNLTLNLALFPDEVTSIAAVLNRDHYQFK